MIAYWSRLRCDFKIFVIANIISICSLVTLFSISPDLFFNQTIKYLIALILLFLIYKVSPKFIIYFTEIFYFVCIFLLISNLFQVASIKRWMSFGSIYFQSSEFMKIALILMLSKFLRKRKMSTLNIFIASFLVFLPFLLILKQPNFGTSLIIFFVGFGMIWLAGLKKWILTFAFFVLLIGIPVTWNKLLPYQKTRIVAFLNPGSDPKGSSYQTIQSVIAIGSGGIFGSSATQNKLGFVPENHTDFLFSYFAEKNGLIFTLPFVFLVFSILLLCLQIAYQEYSNIRQFFACGMTLLIGCESVMNIGMNLGILPVTGVPLPFFSYGGSSLISFFICLGILMNFSKNVRMDL